MNKQQKIDAIKEEIYKLNSQLVELDYDPIFQELEDNLRYQKNALKEAYEELKGFEDDVRWWKKEIVKIKADIEKLEPKVAKRKAKQPKARKDRLLPNP